MNKKIMIKDRLKSKITSVLGLLIIILGIGMIILGKSGVIEFITIVLFGYVLFMSKDDLIEAITLGIFKGKGKDDEK